MKTVFQWETNDQVNLIAVDDYPFAIQVDDGVMLPADGGLELEVTGVLHCPFEIDGEEPHRYVILR